MPNELRQYLQVKSWQEKQGCPRWCSAWLLPHDYEFRMICFWTARRVSNNRRKIKYRRGAGKEGILDPFESDGSLWALFP